MSYRYAENTQVPVEQSRAEVEGVLRRYGCKGFQYGWGERANKRVEQIDFIAKDKHIRFVLVLPTQDDKQFKTRVVRGKKVAASEQQAYKAWDQFCRQRWRALCLCIKAKLEAVNAGITLFEHEFLAQMIDPETHRTIGELMQPWLQGRLTASALIGLPAPSEHPEFEISETK